MNSGVNYEQGFPDEIEVGGEMKQATTHLKSRARERPELTPSRIKYVLENPLVSVISRDRRNRDSRMYWGRVMYNQAHKLMRVALSIDGEKIATAHLDDKATQSWQLGETTYFERARFRDIEVRDLFFATGL